MEWSEVIRGFVSELPITILMGLGGWKLLQFGKGIFYDQSANHQKQLETQEANYQGVITKQDENYKALIQDQEKHYQTALNNQSKRHRGDWQRYDQKLDQWRSEDLDRHERDREINQAMTQAIDRQTQAINKLTQQLRKGSA